MRNGSNAAGGNVDGMAGGAGVVVAWGSLFRRAVGTILVGGVLSTLLVLAVPADERTDSPRVLNVELGGICGTLVGAGVTALGFAKEAATKARGGWAGAAIAAGCLLHDAWEYAEKYQPTPEALAEYQRIQHQFASYRSYDELMTKGLGCTKLAHPPVNPDDVDGRTTYTWDCSKGPYGGMD